jgi:hypothetical protein
MPVTQGDRSGAARPRREKASVHLPAAILGVLPVCSGLMVFQLRRGELPSLQGFLFHLAVVSPLAVVIVFVLLRTLSKEDPRDLNLAPGTLASENRLPWPSRRDGSALSIRIGDRSTCCGRRFSG